MTDEQAKQYIAGATSPEDHRIRLLEVGLLRITSTLESLVKVVQKLQKCLGIE